MYQTSRTMTRLWKNSLVQQCFNWFKNSLLHQRCSLEISSTWKCLFLEIVKIHEPLRIDLFILTVPSRLLLPNFFTRYDFLCPHCMCSIFIVTNPTFACERRASLFRVSTPFFINHSRVHHNHLSTLFRLY